jgi:hypothetical protein
MDKANKWVTKIYWAIIGACGLGAIVAIVSWSLASLNSGVCFSSLSPHGNLCFDFIFIFSIFVFIFVEVLVLVILNKKNIFESWVKFTFIYLFITSHHLNATLICLSVNKPYGFF